MNEIDNTFKTRVNALARRFGGLAALADLAGTKPAQVTAAFAGSYPRYLTLVEVARLEAATGCVDRTLSWGWIARKDHVSTLDPARKAKMHQSVEIVFAIYQTVGGWDGIAAYLGMDAEGLKKTLDGFPDMSPADARRLGAALLDAMLLDLDRPFQDPAAS